MFVMVEKDYERKSYGCGEKAVKSMKHSVPARDYDIKSIDFAKNLCRKDEAEDGDFQGRRKFDMEFYLNPAWDV